MRHHNGSFIWILTRGLVVRDEDGIAIRMAGSQTDITEGKVADPLTGLPNRLYLLDKLQNAVEAYSQRPSLFAVLFLDLDRFKLVNDSLGHAAGDALLTGISSRLLSWLEGFRRTSGPQSIVARLGGDEFGILLHGPENIEAVFRFAEGLLKNLELPFLIEGRQVFATVSIGIALSTSAETPEHLVRNADTAMYYAKARGKSRYELFDESMRDRALARMEIEAGLRRAIEGNELMLYYQPQVSLLDQRVLGYEALVRWNHPQRGILSPGEFVPIAEETDLISHLGRWVLREACRQMAAWHQAWPSDPPLSISVNVAARQLNENDFPDFVAQALRESGLNPASLKLEMTESSIMDNPEKAAATLRRLKSMGLGLEIDDFGTGYSSLSYLQRLPFDTVKIDRSFVKELGTGAEASEIVRTILDLARSFNMHVVAEGVETVDQMNSLSALGCDTAQGFLFSKPVTPAAAAAGIEERSHLRRDFARLQNPSGAFVPQKKVDALVAPSVGV
jgi:diguanylate cyclase (GGDEF)-like protein